MPSTPMSMIPAPLRRLVPLAVVPLALVLAVAACGEPTSGGAAPRGNEATAEPLAPTSLTAIPEPFRGRWDASAAACAGAGSEMRLVVGPDSLRFHESLARVEAVRVLGADAVALDLASEGEGERWSETRTLRLMPDGGLAVEAPGSSANRVRCEGGADEAAAPGDAPTGAEAPRWQSSASGEGAGLSLAAAGGARLLTFLCPAGSGELVVNVPAFRPIASEERMSVGSGGTVFALVADTGGDAERGGVTGRGAFPIADLATILAGAGGIAVNYGAQNSGPHAPPPAAVARDFLAGCPAP